MTATGDVTSPTPEEIGANYDRFTDLFGLTTGDVGLHIGMWTTPGEREPASTLGELANRAQERQTAHHVETLGLKAGEHLLDIGCGTGVPAVRVAQRTGGRVTGINVSREQLARATRTAEAEGVSDRVSFRYGNAMDMEFPSGTFDAALSIDVFAHLSDRQRAFHETARVLRPGGHFLMSDFTARGTPTPEGLDAYMRVWRCMPPTTVAETVSRAADAGFELVRAEDMSQNCAFSGELMGLLYADRHDEIVSRYGPELVAEMDAVVPLVRSFIHDNLGSYLFLFRKPLSATTGT
jgi:cyclopropane fatty-acyl-phospholipid synthase-like methyltransferase